MQNAGKLKSLEVVQVKEHTNKNKEKKAKLSVFVVQKIDFSLKETCSDIIGKKIPETGRYGHFSNQYII